MNNNMADRFANTSGYNAPASSAGVEMKLAPGASIFIKTGNSQNQGARNYQEDSFGYSNIINSDVVTAKGMFAVLADGMGGLSNGKQVSDFVVQSCNNYFQSINPRKKISAQLEQIAENINDSVCEKFGNGAVSKAGSTLVLAYFFKNRVYWITVGDSRLYCFRNGHLLQMNEDHDYKNQLLRKFIDDKGKLETAFTDRQKDSLVSFIGKKGLPETDVSLKGFKIMPEDVFVLCSDGIYNAISEETLMQHLLNYDAQIASDMIVASVIDAKMPGQDNMTVMVIKCSRQ